MFHRPMLRVSLRQLMYLLLAGGALPLLLALTAQYAFGLPPCHFCLLQRYPYLAVIVAAILLWRFPARSSLWLMLAVAGWLTTATLGLYHTGIEEGWIIYKGGCVADTSPALSGEDLRAQIAAAPIVSCDAPLGTFLGLSMASWNAFSALGWVFLTMFLYTRRA